MAYTNIDNPDEHFQITLYTGDGSTSRDITNTGDFDLKPDILWIKNRSAADSYIWANSSWRTDGGDISASLYFMTDSNFLRQYDTTTAKTFNTDGFTIGQNAAINTNAENYVAWQWKLQEGSLSTNTDGDENTSVQVNSDAKISSGTYVGTGTANTSFGHGLGVKPDFIFIRSYSRSENSQIYMNGAETTNGGTMKLDSTTAVNDNPVLLYSQPTASVFSVGTNFEVNQSNGKYVFWAMANVQGFSKSGKYVGNGNADGPFVYTGFKPAWLLVKSTGVRNWLLYDNKRGSFNLNDEYFYTNSNAGESTSSSSGYDFLSNGFKVRNTYGDGNTSGETYAYLAFAENPFVTSAGIPTTAR